MTQKKDRIGWAIKPEQLNQFPVILHRVVPEQEMPASKLLQGAAAIVPAHKA